MFSRKRFQQPMAAGLGPGASALSCLAALPPCIGSTAFSNWSKKAAGNDYSFLDISAGCAESMSSNDYSEKNVVPGLVAFLPDHRSHRRAVVACTAIRKPCYRRDLGDSATASVPGRICPLSRKGIQEPGRREARAAQRHNMGGLRNFGRGTAGFTVVPFDLERTEMGRRQIRESTSQSSASPVMPTVIAATLEGPGAYSAGTKFGQHGNAGQSLGNRSRDHRAASADTLPTGAR